MAGPEAVRYAKGLQKAAPESNGYFEAERKRQEEINSRLMTSSGNENPFRLWRELGDIMTRNVTVIRVQSSVPRQSQARPSRVSGWSKL